MYMCMYVCMYVGFEMALGRSFNDVFGHVSRLASEEVVLHLSKTKCLPALLTWH